jgi:Flp pilus assembly protein TadD
MIYCNQCGSPLAAGLNFCTDCGAAAATSRPAPPPPPPPTLRLNVNASSAAAAAPPGPQQRIVNEPSTASSAYLPQPVPAPPKANAKLIVGVLAAITVFFIVVAAFVASSNQKSPGSTAATSYSSPTTETLLQNAIGSGRLVTLSNDDAYTYYLQLKQSDPQHKALSNIKSQVLPKLRSMGDDTLRRSRSIQWKRVTEQDWRIAQRVYEWAHALEPSDKTLEARWKFAGAEMARLREDKSSAERGYNEASRLDSAWAQPLFSLGLLYMKRDRSDPGDNAQSRGRMAQPYYQRAINLDPDWELPYMSMGTAYYLQGDYDTAETWYRKAMEMNQQWGGPHAWMAAIYEKRRMCSSAISEYERAIELDPNGDEFDVAKTQDKINQIRGYCNG